MTTDMARAYCAKGDHFPEDPIGQPHGYTDIVRYYNDGTPDCWADGTIGFTDEQYADADAEDSLFCEEHGCYIEWRHD